MGGAVSLEAPHVPDEVKISSCLPYSYFVNQKNVPIEIHLKGQKFPGTYKGISGIHQFIPSQNSDRQSLKYKESVTITHDDPTVHGEVITREFSIVELEKRYIQTM